MSSTNAGSEGNLFDVRAVTAHGTSSDAVNVTRASRANIIVHGSDGDADTMYDVHYSPDGTSWSFIASIRPTNIDGGSGLTVGRTAYQSFDVAGVRWVKVVAHSTETVTASCYTN